MTNTPTENMTTTPAENMTTTPAENMTNDQWNVPTSVLNNMLRNMVTANEDIEETGTGEEDTDDEDTDDEDTDDEDTDDEEDEIIDDKWNTLNKLLDSQLQIGEALLIILKQ